MLNTSLMFPHNVSEFSLSVAKKGGMMAVTQGNAHMRITNMQTYVEKHLNTAFETYNRNLHASGCDIVPTTLTTSNIRGGDAFAEVVIGGISVVPNLPILIAEIEHAFQPNLVRIDMDVHQENGKPCNCLVLRIISNTSDSSSLTNRPTEVIETKIVKAEHNWTFVSVMWLILLSIMFVIVTYTMVFIYNILSPYAMQYIQCRTMEKPGQECTLAANTFTKEIVLRIIYPLYQSYVKLSKVYF